MVFGHAELMMRPSFQFPTQPKSVALLSNNELDFQLVSGHDLFLPLLQSLDIPGRSYVPPTQPLTRLGSQPDYEPTW